MERLEDLNLLNLKIYQDDTLYKFTSDSVILSRFAHCKKGDKVADFCAGSGIVGLHLYGLNSKIIDSVTLFEMQNSLYEMSKKTILYNKLEKVFSAVNVKVQDIDKEYNEKFSLIVCNPPYMNLSSGEKTEKEEIAMCKSEVYLPLEDLIKSASRGLKFGGRINMCHRADRLAEVIFTLKKYNLEPKRLQTVSAKNKEPYLILIEGVKGGKSGIKIEKNLEN